MKSLKVYSSRTQWWCSSKIMSYLHRCQALLLSCVVSIWRQSPKSVLKCTAAEIVYRGVYCFRGRKSCFLLFGHSVVSNSLWPMGCSMRGFPVLHHVLELAQTQVQWVSDAVSSSVIPFSSCLQSFPASGSSPRSQFFTSCGQSIGVSISASVLPMNIQEWFPLGLTGLISLQSKELSRVFSNTTVQKHWFFSRQPSLWSNSHIHTWLLENP